MLHMYAHCTYMHNHSQFIDACSYKIVHAAIHVYTNACVFMLQTHMLHVFCLGFQKGRASIFKNGIFSAVFDDQKGTNNCHQYLLSTFL